MHKYLAPGPLGALDRLKSSAEMRNDILPTFVLEHDSSVVALLIQLFRHGVSREVQDMSDSQVGHKRGVSREHEIANKEVRQHFVRFGRNLLPWPGAHNLIR